MTYSYACDNKECLNGEDTSCSDSKLRRPVGMKVSCCHKCDNTNCPDYGVCECPGRKTVIADENTISLIKERYSSNDVEIETYD